MGEKRLHTMERLVGIEDEKGEKRRKESSKELRMES